MTCNGLIGPDDREGLIGRVKASIALAMEHIDPRIKRLHIDAPLAEGVRIAADRGQANYLLNVLRLKAGDNVLLFNGRDGEWLAELAPEGRKACHLVVSKCVREQTPPGDLWYLFAPLKQARLDYMVQKAVEMGASALVPVITAHTQASRINPDRMRANAIEAAEQCGILSLPDIHAPMKLGERLADWPAQRRLIFCDETLGESDPVAALKPLAGQPLALLIGPEGGFSQEERVLLRGLDFVVPIGLGPRILRADTAAVAALALVQAVAGDWQASATGPTASVSDS